VDEARDSWDESDSAIRISSKISGIRLIRDIRAIRAWG
jgi:hypothetical protein